MQSKSAAQKEKNNKQKKLTWNSFLLSSPLGLLFYHQHVYTSGQGDALREEGSEIKARGGDMKFFFFSFLFLFGREQRTENEQRKKEKTKR
jgi:hypothetical protein